MSISMAIKGAGFSILATDTRRTAIYDSETRKTGDYSDDAIKTFMTNFGWVGYSGGVTLCTTQFEKSLKASNAVLIDDIYADWLQSIKLTQNYAEELTTEKNYKKVCSSTSTSTAVCALNQFNNGKAEMFINVLDFGFGIRNLEENDLYVSNPEHSKQIKRIVDRYAQAKKVNTIDGAIIDTVHTVKITDIHAAIYLLACLIEDISKVTNWISSTINYGISMQVSQSEILLLSLYGNSTDLKAIYHKKHDYSEQIKVCGVITENSKGDGLC